MKKAATLLLTLALCISTALGQTPVIRMTVYSEDYASYIFYLKAKTSNTPIQVDFGDGILVNKTIDTSFTTVIGTLTQYIQTVKVYGDGITSLLCGGWDMVALDVSNNTALTELLCKYAGFGSLDVSKNLALTTLECSNGWLNTLDVSSNTVLTSLDCSNNRFSTLDVGKNAVLTTLNCSGNEISAMDVSLNPLLVSLNCSRNHLSTLDLSNNTALTYLDCSVNQLSTLKVGEALTELYCHTNHLSSLDLGKNTVMKLIDCDNNELNTLDVSKYSTLTLLNCAMNKLSALNVSNSSALTSLNCSFNRLLTLDVSKDAVFTYFFCEQNRLSFATLPLEQASWQFTYAPQEPISIAKVLTTGIELDLSNQLTVNGNTSVYTWKTQSGATLVEGTDYSIAHGKTTFIKAQSDSVYCEMANATFPDFTGTNVLKTTNARITFGTAVADLKIDWFDVYSHYKTIFINLSYNAQLSIYDTNGRLVVSKPLNSGSTNLQLPATGIYLVKLTRGKDAVTRKVFAE